MPSPISPTSRRTSEAPGATWTLPPPPPEVSPPGGPSRREPPRLVRAARRARPCGRAALRSVLHGGGRPPQRLGRPEHERQRDHDRSRHERERALESESARRHTGYQGTEDEPEV